MRGSRRLSVRVRQAALVAHRYVGLLLVVFLTTAGLTGAILAFQREFDALVNPHLFEVPEEERDLPNLDPFEVAARVEAQMPAGQHFRSVQFELKPGVTISTWIEENPDDWHEWFVSPKTGRALGSRRWADLSEGKQNLIPFIYRLHYSLGFGDVGIVLFGIAALLWTFDCFVGAYLTFPQASPRHAEKRLFFVRWLPAWTIRTTKLFSLIFTWHRASGLWIWAFLLIFAWSGVGFNLSPAYRPVMDAVFGMKPAGHELLPQLARPFPKPKLTLRRAHELARKEMEREAAERGFTIRRELNLYYASDHGAFAYSVESSLDISSEHPRTEVYIDGQTGSFLGFDAPTGVGPGNTVSNWLFHLHMGMVFGDWYRVLVALVGLSVVGLSVTGTWIWWRKRSRPRARKQRHGAFAATSQEREEEQHLWSHINHLPPRKPSQSSAQ